MKVLARPHAARLFLALGLAAFACSLAGSAAAFSGSNAAIVFVRGGTLHTIQNGSVTDLPLTGTHPMWSPAGTKLAFDDGTSIYTANADGSGVSAALATGTDPAWSPDGSQLAFVSSGDLYTVSATGGSATKQTSSTGVTEPAWSPDGKKIAYVFDDGSQRDVLTFTVASGAVSNLTNSGAQDSAPAWSPDGLKIVFVSTRDNASGELYTMSPDGNDQSRLSSSTSGAGSPTWSPDGANVAFSKSSGIWSIVLSDKATSQVTSTAGDTFPDWQSGFSISKPVVDAPNGTTDGSTLTVLPVTYTGSAAPTGYTYAWKRCNAAGDGCTTISGATGSSYTIQSLDVGSTIRAVVTATSDAGTASATSDATVPVTAGAPANTIAPTITGGTAAAVGVELTAATGSWSGTTPISFSYQWERCNASGASCSDISGATSSKYAPVGTDIGATLRVRVTANNGVGSAVSVESGPTIAVVSSAPTNSAEPSINGTPKVGFVVTASVGTWTGAPIITYRYQWQRCDGDTCANVGGAISSAYSVTNADVGNSLRIQITATNSVGTATAVSVKTDVIEGTVPTNTVRPSISGIGQVGQTLFANVGTWLGSPTSYTYVWSRCTSTTSCAPVSGATSNTYRLETADQGATIMVTITAKNTSGSGSASSAPTPQIQAGTGSTGGGSTTGRPANTTPPAVTGVLAKGEKVTADEGKWNGTTPLAFTYQWQRCAAKTLTCAGILKATSKTYALVAADVGKRIRVVVTARNSLGLGTATSAPSRVVRAAASPKSVERPVAAGVAAKGRVLEAVTGVWRGATPLKFTYVWQRCVVKSKKKLSCKTIAKAKKATYKLVAADVGKRIRVIVWARNASGRGRGFALPTPAVAKKAPKGKRINGTKKAQKLNGTSGADVIHGRAGSDRINGLAGADWLFGDAGNDRIEAGKGADHVFAGAGNDVVTTVDGMRDWIDCGDGKDKVTADAIDVVSSSCETIVRRTPTARKTQSARVHAANRLHSLPRFRSR